MNRALVVCCILVQLFCVGLCFADNNNVNESHRIEFEHKNIGFFQYYVKHNRSGVAVNSELRIRLREDWSIFDVTYVGPCKNERSMEDIAKAFYELVNYFNLQEVIKSKKFMSINIGQSAANELLIRRINEDESWPKNIYKILNETQPDRGKRFGIYVESIRKNIVDTNLFAPFEKVMAQFGCRMTLQEYFLDGIFLTENNNISKESMVQRGVFTEEEAKKDYYPMFKRGIFFDLHCADESPDAVHDQNQ